MPEFNEIETIYALVCLITEITPHHSIMQPKLTSRVEEGITSLKSAHSVCLISLSRYIFNNITNDAANTRHEILQTHSSSKTIQVGSETVY